MKTDVREYNFNILVLLKNCCEKIFGEDYLGHEHHPPNNYVRGVYESTLL